MVTVDSLDSNGCILGAKANRTKYPCYPVSNGEIKMSAFAVMLGRGYLEIL